MEPLSLHIGGASKAGLPLAPLPGPLSNGLPLPDAPSAPRDDASDDEVGVDDLLAFGGADAHAAKRSLAFNAGKYDEAVRSIEALGRDPMKKDGKVVAREMADDAARPQRAKAVEDEFEKARNAVTRVTPQKVKGSMLGDDDDASTASSEVSLHEDVLSDDDEAPKLLTLEELRARKTDVETLPAVRRIATMRRKAAPDDKYSVDYSRFAAIDSSDDDEPTRADAYRTMDFGNLPKPPSSSSKEGFTSVLDMCDELAPEPPPPDKERRDGLYFEKTNQFVPYANEFAVPHVPPDASAKLGALIDRFKPK